MSSSRQLMDERVAELQEAMVLLEDIDRAAKKEIAQPAWLPSPEQVHILYASFYLQIYNMVEAVVNSCVDELLRTILNSHLKPRELSTQMKAQWVKDFCRLGVDAKETTRTEKVLDVVELILLDEPVGRFEINDKSGNWDDQQIEKFFNQKLGCKLDFPEDVIRSAKRARKDDLNALALVKRTRNQLAHGNLSFGDFGEGTSVGEIAELYQAVRDYMYQVVSSFESYLAARTYAAV